MAVSRRYHAAGSFSADYTDPLLLARYYVTVDNFRSNDVFPPGSSFKQIGRPGRGGRVQGTQAVLSGGGDAVGRAGFYRGSLDRKGVGVGDDKLFATDGFPSSSTSLQGLTPCHLARATACATARHHHPGGKISLRDKPIL